MFAHLVIISSCVKLLLLPCYTSTDFEVHRNWLAITHSLPIQEWYTENRSEWTLDYPPFFAWFEWTLAKVASLINIDPDMLKVDNLGHKSFNTVLFQRLSVILTDIVLAIGVLICCFALKSKPQRNGDIITFLPALALTNAGLFMVDHIHFQYNGFLLGILLSSVGLMMQEWYLSSACLFAVLLNLKHIYLYCAPAYFIYLLSTYCRPKGAKILGFSLTRLFSLAVIVLSIFGLSLGPFIAHNQLFIVLQRLFPFKRGLTHAYWAPNFWALYNAIDRIAIFLAKRAGLESLISVSCLSHSGASTSGLVKDTVHCILPSVTPLVTFALTAVSLLPILWKLWQSQGDSLQFLRAVVLCNFCSFFFGWHVHEKAILLVTVPLAVLAVASAQESRSFTILSTVGNFSLFPLLFQEQETVIKCLLTFWHFLLTTAILRQRRKMHQKPLRIFEKVYLVSMVFVFALCAAMRYLPSMGAMEFLPLMIYSIYCTIGVLYEFVVMLSYYFNNA